jgi:hypothetical protein
MTANLLRYPRFGLFFIWHYRLFYVHVHFVILKCLFPALSFFSNMFISDT